MGRINKNEFKRIPAEFNRQLARIGVNVDAMGPTCVGFEIQDEEEAVELYDEWARWTLSINDALAALRHLPDATGDVEHDYNAFCCAMNEALR